MNDRELAALLDMDGRHKPLDIEGSYGLGADGTTGLFFSRCSCGYKCTRRQTPQQAAEALIHHMRTVGRQMVAAGRVSMPAVRKHAASMR